MGNGETTKTGLWAHLFELWAKVCKLVIEGKRDPQKIIDFLQAVIMEPQEKFKLLLDLGTVTHPDGRCFRVTVLGHARKVMTTTSQERLDALTARGATLLGQLGLDLLRQQGLCEKLTKGSWYNSFEAGNFNCVPYFYTFSDGVWRLNLCPFESTWDDDARLLCFVEVKE